MKRPIGKLSLSDQLAASDKALCDMAAMTGKPIVHRRYVAPEKIVRTPRKPTEDLEGPVQTAIGELLAIHPKVLFAVRQNSGMMQTEYQNKSTGEVKSSYTWFYKWARRRSKKMRITDFWGMLVDGRMFAIEAKKPSWTKPTDDREHEQMEFMLTVRSAGGVSGFANCVEQAQAILEGK